jgi:hypothetical protein
MISTKIGHFLSIFFGLGGGSLKLPRSDYESDRAGIGASSYTDSERSTSGTKGFVSISILIIINN